MKKVIQVLAIVLLFSTVGSMTSSAAPSDAAAKGFYSVEAGKEQYYSISQFKKLSRPEKVSIFTGNYYLIANGNVFPVAALDYSDEEFIKSKISEAEFEKEHKVQLDSSGKITQEDGSVDENFKVLSID